MVSFDDLPPDAMKVALADVREPDMDDYTDAASNAARMGFGVDPTDRKVFFDGATGQVAVIDRWNLADIDADYLSEDIRTAVDEIADPASIDVVAWAPHRREVELSQATTWAQPAHPTEEQRNEIAAQLSDAYPELEWDRDMVDEFCSNPLDAAEQYVPEVIAAWRAAMSESKIPGVATANTVADAMRHEAQQTFSSECDHLGSDEWRRDEAVRDGDRLFSVDGSTSVPAP